MKRLNSREMSEPRSDKTTQEIKKENTQTNESQNQRHKIENCTIRNWKNKKCRR